MKLKELMTGVTPDEEYAGITNTDDFVLAVDITGTADTKKADYVVVQTGVTAVDAQLNPETEDKTYLRTGKSTNKTATPVSYTHLYCAGRPHLPDKDEWGRNDDGGFFYGLFRAARTKGCACGSV